jgi:DNA-binding MarR family transcriptional regulator
MSAPMPPVSGLRTRAPGTTFSRARAGFWYIVQKRMMTAETGMGRDLENDLGFLIHDVARFMRRKFDREVRVTGLTRAQWWVLVELLRDNGQTQSGLAENMELDKATLSSLIDKLETAGFVRRQPDPHDRRVKRVLRTEKVNAILPMLSAAGEALYAQAFAGIEPAERRSLQDLLLRLKRNLIAESGVETLGENRAAPLPAE